MYDELLKRLRASCESCKLWDGYKCCLKGECSAQTRLQAADAIEELQAAEKKYLANIGALETENQHLKREREWMPVTERLPDFEGCLLCMRKAFVGNNLRYQDILYYEEGTFYMEFEDTPIPTECITHWMPLPTPPKEE